MAFVYSPGVVLMVKFWEKLTRFAVRLRVSHDYQVVRGEPGKRPRAKEFCHFSHLSSPWSFFFLSSDIFLGLGHFLSLTDRKIAYVVISL